MKKNYLCLYSKGDECVFIVTKNGRETFTTLHNGIKNITWTEKDRFARYPFNSWEDFKAIKNELKQYALDIFVAEHKSSDKTSIAIVIYLMNKPLWESIIAECEEKNEINTFDEMENVRFIKINNKSDWDYAEKEFNIKLDFWKNLFIDEKEIN